MLHAFSVALKHFKYKSSSTHTKSSVVDPQLLSTSPASTFQKVSSGSGFDVVCYIQCCGSGMFIADPGSGFFPIPDPKKHGKVKNFFF